VSVKTDQNMMIFKSLDQLCTSTTAQHG